MFKLFKKKRLRQLVIMPRHSFTPERVPFKSIANIAKDAIIILDDHGRIVYWNPMATRIFGYKRGEILGKDAHFILAPPQYHQQYQQGYPQFSSEGKGKVIGKTLELEAVRKTGEVFPIELTVSLLHVGERHFALGIVRDITRRKKAEEELQKYRQQLEQLVEERTRELKEINKRLRVEIKIRQQIEQKLKHSLKEKEVLLQEIHHRVKNNFQLVCSLLNLQAFHTTSEEARRSLQEGQSRIRSMALIHEMLYQSFYQGEINFAQYIKNLMSHLQQMETVAQKDIQIRIDVEDIYLGIKKAIPCGLIVNEIVTNAFKHAFLDRDRGEIVIMMQEKEGQVYLQIKDNGVGLPSDIDISRTRTLGLRLIHDLIQQLGGVVEIERQQGTAYLITF
jgi:PAS domain S-box-containing protein